MAKPRVHYPSYRSRRYIEYKAYLKAHMVECWVRDEFGKCTNRATIPDHYPPISTVPNPFEWRGEYLPMCRQHSDIQAGKLRHNKFLAKPSRRW